jgi:thymidylate synthase ThyX
MNMIESRNCKRNCKICIPVGQYTEFIWTVNLRVFLNFLSLRNDENAQKEIRQYAEVIERCNLSVCSRNNECFEKTTARLFNENCSL